MNEVPAAQHAHSCAMFTSGHDASGTFRPVACDCHLADGAA